MIRTDARQERTSLPATQKVELRQPTVAGQRSSLSAARDEPKRRTVTDDDVRHRAYEIYLRRGGAPGRDLDDWLQAERELRGN
jgi:hypothetical protein